MDEVVEGGAPHNGISVFIRRGRTKLSLSLCVSLFLSKTREDTMRKQLSTSQEEGHHQELSLLTP